jgi:hypothetical protein
VQQPAAVDTAAQAALAGRYHFEFRGQTQTITVREAGGALHAELPIWRGARRLYPAGDDRYFFLESGAELSFVRDGVGPRGGRAPDRRRHARSWRGARPVSDASAPALFARASRAAAADRARAARPAADARRAAAAAGRGAELWVKRDDLSGEAYGGNKVRKLEFVLAEARRRGAGRLITAGAAGSHHALATAVYGGRLGLP